jgi:peptidoglycan/xylan/chitin deacetylase (PgdA/CDA1 family)
MPATPSGLKAFKLGLLASAKKSGLMQAVRDSRWRARRLLIVAYHSVARFDEHEFSPELYLPPSALRHRFELLRRDNYSVLALKDALQRLSDGTLPARSVALTFDDGTNDFSEIVVPLLKEYGYPATVYVTTHYAAKDAPVFRIACRYLLWVGRNRTIDGSGLTATGEPIALDSLDARDAAQVAIEAHIADDGLQAEMAALRLLSERVGVDFDQFLAERRSRLMTAAEIEALPTDLVDVQLHTHRHKVPRRREAFEREINDNRLTLKAWRPASLLDGFCYPSGVTDLSFLPWLRDLGVNAATTCRPGLTSTESDPLLLPRLVDSWRMTELELEGWLTGVSQFLPRVPRRNRYQPEPVYD